MALNAPATSLLAPTFAGSLFHATPLWILYLRLNGARVGRGVYVNSLALVDHNLLEFGDSTVIGSGVFLSGHTVESGVVKTAPVQLVGHRKIDAGLVTIVVRGDVASVEAAVRAGAARAAQFKQLVATHVIPRPDDQVHGGLPIAP